MGLGAMARARPGKLLARGGGSADMSLKEEPSIAWRDGAPAAASASVSGILQRVVGWMRPHVPLLLGSLLALPLFATQLYDDVYVHARVAINLVEHGAPAFNIGDHFKASSSTGYVIILAIASLILEPAVAIRLIQAAVVALTISTLASLCVSARVSLFKLTLVLAAVIPHFLIAAYGGMESSIVCLLWALAAKASVRGDDRMMTITASLAVWFRFEAILMLGLVLYCRLRRDDLKLLVYAAPAAILFALELALYGQIVPHALAAKTAAYDYPLLLSAWHALTLGERGELRLLAMVVSAALLITGATVAARLLPRRLEMDFGQIAVLFSAALLCAWMFGRTLIFPWYYCLLSFPLGLYVLRPLAPSGTGLWREALPISVMAALAVLGPLKADREIGFEGHPSANARVFSFLRIGAQLHAHCPSCTLLSSEIGGLGYAFKGRIHDALGLGDPSAIPFHPLKVPQERQYYSVGAIPPRYAEARDPDFIVTMPMFARALSASAFIKRYAVYDCPFGEGVGTIWGDDSVRVFAKTPLPAHILEPMRCGPAKP